MNFKHVADLYCFQHLCGWFTASITVLKTGLNIIMACNIPKNSPMLEVFLFL